MSNEQTEHDKKKNVWEVVLKIIIAVASAVAGALGVTACVGLVMSSASIPCSLEIFNKTSNLLTLTPYFNEACTKVKLFS